MTIAIPGIPCGNFASVVRMIERGGGKARILERPSQLADSGKVILAGVGAFDYGMRNLQDGWIDALNELVQVRKAPALGICLGMQLMCASSEEGGLPGLGWIDAVVRRFVPPETEPGLKIPHMGWNTVSVAHDNPLLPRDGGEQRFYFVHSYHPVCSRPEEVLATAHYGYDFVAAVHRDNVFGVQFHPEKSHRFGMALLRNFVEL